MKKVIAICILVNLAGCASYESRFDCNAPDGVGCKSVSEINDMVNHKEIGQGSKVENQTLEIESGEISYQTKADRKTEKKIVRLPERTMSIWVKGFTDDKGDYIENTKMHTVIEAGGWQEIEQ